MSDKVNVTLDCRNFSTNGDGYTNVTGSNGQPYSYKYTGGTDGNGNVTVKKEGQNRRSNTVIMSSMPAVFQFFGKHVQPEKH
jgi:hypothetical protein